MKRTLAYILGAMMILGLISGGAAFATGSSSGITSAAELQAAVNAAADGDTLTLGANISYDWADLGTMIVSKSITLDFNGYKITTTTGLFDVASEGSLTLVRAQIDSRYENNIYGVFNEVYGSLIIESTEGNGLDSRSDDSGSVDIVEYNYGQVIIKDGTFYPGYCVVYENYGNASVTIENAAVDAERYIIGYLEDDGCSLLIQNGTYQTGDCIIYGLNGGNAVIENGTFVSANYCVDLMGSGTLTVQGGAFTAEDGSCFDIHGDAVLNIEGGEFTSNSYTVYASENAAVNLSGGAFENTTGEAAFYTQDAAEINIADGFVAEPEDWQGTNTPKIEIYPKEVDVVFLDTNGVEIYRETVSGNAAVSNWPDTPASPGEDYRWWGWVDAEGNRYSSASIFKKDTVLQAMYINEGLPEDPEDPDEPDEPEQPAPPEYPEKPAGSPVVVTSYDELKAAINNGESNILVAGDIVFPQNGSLTIQNNDTYITGEDGVTITGPGTMFYLRSNATASFENLTISASSGNVFYMYNAATVNIVSGSYAAPDDVVNGSNSATINLYGGTLVEQSGSDGPIYYVGVRYMNNTTDVNPDVHIVEVGAKEQITVTFYNGEEVYETVQMYRYDILSLPENPEGDFMGWYSADGTQFFGGAVSESMDLYAKFRQENVTVTFIVGDEQHESVLPYGSTLSEADGFDLAPAWKDGNNNVWVASSIVTEDVILYPASESEIVTTLEEFKAAVAGNNDTIIVGAEIPVTETLVVDRSVSIGAINGGALIRPEGFDGVLLSIETNDGEEPTEVTIGNLLIDGKDIEANNAAVAVDNDSSLILRGTTIQKNINLNESYYNETRGGAIYSLGKVYIYEGTTLCSNKAEMGGAIFLNCDDDTACLYMYGGDICHNSALKGDHDGAGGGVKIDDCEVMDEVVFYMFGGRIHHNSAGYDGYGASGGGVALSCGDDGIHFVMYDGEITDNHANSEGGGVFTGCSSMVMYGGLMARNTAGESGGAVATCCCHNTFYMYGGVITLNTAAYGGGVDSTDGGPYEIYGNLYGNFASESGDDILAAYTQGDNNSEKTVVRRVNDSVPYNNPYYGESDLQELMGGRPDYRLANPIDGYEINTEVLLKHLGWFVDTPEHRYVEGDSPIQRYATSATLLLGSEQDVKAVYGGYFLVYDANYGTGEYKYDSITYQGGEEATTQDCMFSREGYRFLGWNTSADGTGFWYYPDLNGYNRILMDSNKVVYAQWEKIPVGDLAVSKTLAGNAADTEKEFSFTVTLSDKTISGTYGDVTFEDGAATFVLKGGESKTIEGLLHGTEYTVVEADYRGDGYETAKTGDTGTIVGEATQTAAFTNTRNTYGDLAVSKTLAGNAAETEKEFSFTVTLSDKTISGTYGDVTFESGNATFVLKGGESKTIEGLPNGTEYTVEEADYSADGYETAKTGDTGTIVGDETQTAAFTNTLNATATPTATPSPAPVPTRVPNTFYFSFIKEWGGEPQEDISFTIYNPNGTVKQHRFNRTKISETEWRYEAWFSAGADYYVVETPVNGYTTAYINIGEHADVTDRVYNGGRIINYQVPKTGDNANVALWIGCALAGIVLLGGLAVIIRRKKR